jgi:protease I
MTESQRALTRAGAEIRVVAPEQGVVHGWQGESWGHHHNVDKPIAEALGSDFDMLVLPGGSRGAAKLKQNPHTRRIVNHFLDAGKPVTAIGEGVGLLALGAAIAGRRLAAMAAIAGDVKAAQAIAGDDNQEVDQNLLTSNGNDLAEWVESSVAFFAEAPRVTLAA